MLKAARITRLAYMHLYSPTAHLFYTKKHFLLILIFPFKIYQMSRLSNVSSLLLSYCKLSLFELCQTIRWLNLYIKSLHCKRFIWQGFAISVSKFRRYVKIGVVSYSPVFITRFTYSNKLASCTNTVFLTYLQKKGNTDFIIVIHFELSCLLLTKYNKKCYILYRIKVTSFLLFMLMAMVWF